MVVDVGVCVGLVVGCCVVVVLLGGLGIVGGGAENLGLGGSGWACPHRYFVLAEVMHLLRHMAIITPKT